MSAPTPPGAAAASAPAAFVRPSRGDAPVELRAAKAARTRALRVLRRSDPERWRDQP